MKFLVDAHSRGGSSSGCANASLLAIFDRHLIEIEAALADSPFLELSASGLVVHGANDG